MRSCMKTRTRNFEEKEIGNIFSLDCKYQVQTCMLWLYFHNRVPAYLQQLHHIWVLVEHLL